MSVATWVLKPALVVLLAYAAQWCVRKRGAPARHLVWTKALLFLAILPLLPTEPLSVSALTVAIPLEAGRIAGPLAQPGTGRVEDAAPFVVDAAATADRRWTFPIHLIWIAGTLALLAHWVLSFRKAMHVVRRSRPYMRYGGVPVVLSDEVSVPFTLGWRASVIVLPAKAEAWSEVRRAHVLAHEYAHVARYDWWTQTVSRMVCAVYWFHPLVWWAAAWMRRESEHACDDAAILATGADTAAYAEDLFLLACNAEEERQRPAGALAMWGRSKSQLEVRVKNILNPVLNRRPLSGAFAAVVACGTLAVFLPVAGLRLQAQPGTTHVTGIVTDPSGAAIPGAKVEVRALGADAKLLVSAETGPDGSLDFRVAQAPASISVTHPGFAPMSGPFNPTSDSQYVRFSLRLGQIRETISVAGTRPATPPPSATSPSRVRVGGMVQAASLIARVEPVYPADLQAQGIQGIVELDAIVSKDGSVLSLHSRTPGAHAGLVNAASDAVRQWRYKPTLLNGEPVEVLTTVTVRFLLN